MAAREAQMRTDMTSATSLATPGPAEGAVLGVEERSRASGHEANTVRSDGQERIAR
jgi:hypothetical protein